jgi:peptidoglycan lytic transglycosylase
VRAREECLSAEVAEDALRMQSCTVRLRPLRILSDPCAKIFFLAILLAVGIAACSHSRTPRSAVPAPKASAPEIPAEQIGLAAWIGSFHAGQRTASGDVFDPDGMTGAHRTLPLGTFVWVTNLANNRHVKVKINDRGPRDESRIIELSRAAAQKLGFAPSDVMKVKIEPVD